MPHIHRTTDLVRRVLRVAGAAALSWTLAACGGGSAGSSPSGDAASAKPTEEALAVSPRAVPSMSSARWGHTATVLPDGRVLVAGGFGPGDGTGSLAIRECEIYDPVTNTWKRVASMKGPHGLSRAVLLPDGRVLVVGGLSGPPWGKLTYAANEIYDPATNTWTLARASARRVGHTATLLADGRVFVAGGSNYKAYPGRYSSLRTAEIYDPATNSWTPAAPLPRPRGEHTAALQPDGRVLVAGFAVEHYAGEQTRSTEGGIDLYDPATNTWSNVAYMVDDVSYGLVAALPDGQVLVNRAVLHVGASTWTALRGLAGDRTVNAPHVVLPDGRVVAAGGGWNLSWDFGFNDSARTDVFDPVAKTWTLGRSMSVTRDEHSMTVLRNGKILIAGGRDPFYTPLKTAELLIPGELPRTPSVPADLDGDGKGDLLWRNTSNGAIEYWRMNGLQRLDSAPLRGANRARLAGTGDFNGDGKADLLWDEKQLGYATVWLMNGENRTGTLKFAFGPNTSPLRAADVDADGLSAPVWRDDAKRTMVLQIDSKNPESASWTTDERQTIVAAADFTGDGTDDFIVYDSRDRTTSLWRMFGPRLVGTPTVLMRGATWRVVGAPDLDGDGQPDLLWRNVNNGAVTAWLMNGARRVQTVDLLDEGKNWTVVATPDLNGDRRDDIVWYDRSRGVTMAWLMAGDRVLQSKVLRTSDDWEPVGP